MSVYFTDDEFTCRCGRSVCDAIPKITDELRDRLHHMREVYAAPLIVTSGIRCAWWNEQQGGKPDSEHLRGEAADLACTSSERRWEMLHAAFEAGVRRVGVGSTFLHVGVSRILVQDVLWTYTA